MDLFERSIVLNYLAALGDASLFIVFLAFTTDMTPMAL